MRKIVFCVLSGILMAVVTGRALLPESARAVSDGELYGYNISQISLPATTATAGSALLADLNGYYLFRTPTAKNEWTGALAGKDLVLICAENWQVPANPSRTGDGALYSLQKSSAALGAVYRTDWYQGTAGQYFALLTGLVPTTINDLSALSYTGQQQIHIPYALAGCLAREGYRCAAYVKDDSQRKGLEALGFQRVESAEDPASALEELEEGERFFLFISWEDADCSDALDTLLDALRAGRRRDSTVICLLAAARTDGRDRLFICADELEGASSAKPCSALDVTPTLLNLYGIEYDSRFLGGLDLFSQNGETGVVRAVTPVVSLYGSAFSDWISDAGQYSGAGSIFRQTADCFADSEEVSAYVRDVSRLVYDRYVYTRKAMECDYFRVAMG